MSTPERGEAGVSPERSPYRLVAGATAVVMFMALTVWLIITLRTFMIVLLVGGLLAAALDRPVNITQRRLHLSRRGPAVALVVVLLLSLILSVGYVTASPFAHQSQGLRKGLPARVAQVKSLPIIGPRLKSVDLEGKTRAFLSALPKRLSAHRNLVLGVATTAFNWLLLAITVIAVCVFMLLNGPRIAESASAQILDDVRRVRARRLAGDALQAVGGYVVGNLLISFMAAVVTAVALLVMGIPFVAVLAVIMFLLDLIPMVGATLGGVVVTAATFVLDPHPWKALVFVLIYTLYQLIETHTIYPVVMGRTIKIGAFGVFLVTLAGGELAGILGALLAIPIGAVLNVVIKDLLDERRGRAQVTSGSSLARLQAVNAGLPSGEGLILLPHDRSGREVVP